MSVSTYKREKQYEIGQLQPYIYLVNKDAKIDYVIDNGEALVKRVIGTAYKIYGSKVSLSSEETISGRFKFNNKVEFVMKETQISSLMDIAKYLRDDDWKIIVEDMKGNQYIMNLDFYAQFSYLYLFQSTLDNECTFTFQTDSNFPTLHLESNLINVSTIYDRPCLYNNGKFDELMLCEYNNAYIVQDEIRFSDVRWTGTNGFSKIDYLKNSAQFQEEFDGTQYTQTIQFAIPLSEYKSYWHYNLIEFTQNKYVALVSTTNHNVLASGFENGYFPSYTIETSDAPGTLNTITIKLTSITQRPLTYQTLPETGNIDDVINQDKSTRFVNVDDFYVNDILYKTTVCVGNNLGKRILFQEITSTGDRLNRYWVHVDYQNTFIGSGINIVGTFNDTSDMGIPLTFVDNTCKEETTCNFIQVPPQQIVFTDKDDEVNINIEATCDWTILSIPEWLEIDIMSGKGGTAYRPKLQLVDEKLGNTNLSANITISMGGQYYTFTVLYIPGSIQGDIIENCEWYNGDIDNVSFKLTMNNRGQIGITQAGGYVDIQIYDEYASLYGLTIDNIIWEGSSYAYFQKINSKTVRLIISPNNTGSDRDFVWKLSVTGNDGKKFVCEQNLIDCQFTYFTNRVKETGYICENNNKYERYAVYQGQTLDTINQLVRYEKGDIIETNSTDCAENIEYRWVQTSNKMCEGASQYWIEEQQMRVGSGSWQTTGQTRKGQLIENNSPDCDNSYKWEDSGTFECDGRAQYQILAKLYDNGDGVWRDTGERKRGKLINSFSTLCQDASDSTIMLTFDAFHQFESGVFGDKTVILDIQAVGEWQINWGDYDTTLSTATITYSGNQRVSHTYDSRYIRPYDDNPYDKTVKIGGNIKVLSIIGNNETITLNQFGGSGGATTQSEKTSTILRNADWSKATSLEKLYIFKTVSGTATGVYPESQAKLDIGNLINLEELYVRNWTFGSYTNTTTNIFVPPTGNNLERIDIVRSGGGTPRFTNNTEFKNYFCKPCVDGNRTFAKPCIVNICPHSYNGVQLGCGADFSDMYAEGWFVSVPCCETNGSVEYQYSEGTSTTCIGLDKWSVGTLQQRTYNGTSWSEWTDVEGVVLPMRLIESNSVDCGYIKPVEPQYKWVQSSEYMCDGTDSYYIEYQQVSNDNGATWSNTGSQRKGALRQQNDVLCGYTPPIEYQYRWVDVANEFICEESDAPEPPAPTRIYEWEDVEGEYICEESDEPEPPVPVRYEWNNIGTTVCDGYDLYHELVYQVSYDNGKTWQDVEPRQTKKANLIKRNSQDCGYKPVDYNSGLLSGKWTDNSTSDQWYITNYQKPNTSYTSSFSLKDYTNPDTKEFSIEIEMNNKLFINFFNGNSALEKIYTIPFFGRGVTSMAGMFNSCSNLNEIKNVEYWDVSSVENIGEMFMNCTSLQTLNLSGWDLLSVKNIYSLFNNCNNLVSLDLSGWDVSNVQTITWVFRRCSSLNHIKCSQEFKDWCWTNQDKIELPTQMREGGTGTWEIV